MSRALGLLLIIALAAAGCVEKKRYDSASAAELRKEILLASAPKPEHPLDIQFGDKVKLLGYDVSTERAREEQAFTVTWYWQVLAPLGEGWKVFTHLADGAKNNRINMDSARPLREALPEETWKAGQLLRDVQEIVLPEDWNSPTVTFYLGFWKGSTRLPITEGKGDGERRVAALTLPVEATGSESKVEAPIPRLVARRVREPITLDGKLDEADWAATEKTAPFVNTMTGGEATFRATARVLYDADALYLAYEVEDDFLRSTFTKDDEHLWEQDVVEVMVDPDGDEQNYFELQVAPTGLHFDTRYDSRRKPRPFGDMGWSSQVRAKVQTRGTVNDDEDDEGYTVEMAIPWSAFAAGGKPAAPPDAGSTWRVAFFVMDAREQGQRAAGWSPPLVGDFHTLHRFGRVVFPQAAVSAQAPAAPQPVRAQPTSSAPE